MRILAVDDDPVSLKLVVSILEKHDFEVVAKPSGKEALIFLRKGTHVDLIVSDVEMPVVDGS